MQVQICWSMLLFIGFPWTVSMLFVLIRVTSFTLVHCCDHTTGFLALVGFHIFCLKCTTECRLETFTQYSRYTLFQFEPLLCVIACMILYPYYPPLHKVSQACGELWSILLKIEEFQYLKIRFNVLQKGKYGMRM